MLFDKFCPGSVQERGNSIQNGLSRKERVACAPALRAKKIELPAGRHCPQRSRPNHRSVNTCRAAYILSKAEKTQPAKYPRLCSTPRVPSHG